MNPTEIIADYRDLRIRKKRLQAELLDVAKQLEQVLPAAEQAFHDLDMRSVTLSDGDRVTLGVKSTPRARDGGDSLCSFLDKADAVPEFLVRPRYHHLQFGSWVKEQIEENDGKLPSHLAEHIEMYDEPKITVTEGKKP